MATGNTKTLTILDTSSHNETIRGHNFYHTSNKRIPSLPKKPSHLCPRSLHRTRKGKEEIMAKYPMTKTPERTCPPDPDLNNRLKNIINHLDTQQSTTLAFMQDASN
jgi:hypothetical protein